MLDSATLAPPDERPQPQARAAGVADRIGSLAEAVLLSGFPTQIAIGGLLGAAGVDPRTGDRLSFEYVMWVWLLDAALIFGLAAALAKARGDRLVDILLGARPIRQEAALGLGLIPVVFGGVLLVLAGIRLAAPSLHNVAANPFGELIRSPLHAAALAAMAVLSGGVKEEVQRAFVLRRFEQHLGGAWVGIGIFSVAFGAGHFLQGWDVGVVTTLLGAFWGVLYVRRRSMAAAAISHAGFNVAQILQHLVFAS